MLKGTQSRNRSLFKFFILSGVISLFALALQMGTIALFNGNNAQAADLPRETILRFHGSNTIGAKLAPTLAVSFLKDKLGAKSVNILPQKANEVVVEGQFEDKIMAVEIQAHGSSTSFKGLRDYKCDIGMASRKIKAKEVDFLSFLGNMTSFACEYTLGLDGIAVIINKSNPIKSLRIDQISAIFAGKITNWSQIGGNAGPIQVFARDDKSGTYDTFKSLVLGKKTPLVGSAKRFESNADLSRAVSSEPSAIGFTGLPYVLRSKAISVADGDSPAVFPTPFTIATEDYALARRLYLYTPMYPENIYTRFFIDYALSPEGQEIVKKVEFIDQNIKTFKLDVDPNQKAQNPAVLKNYVNATRNAERVSLNFRFQSGSTDLENRSTRNLQRIVSYMRKADPGASKELVLVGFADSIGDYQINLNIARNRAQTVADELKTRGLKNQIRVISAGEEAPIASNSTEGGREKNRRVEVWIR